MIDFSLSLVRLDGAGLLRINISEIRCYLLIESLLACSKRLLIIGFINDRLVSGRDATDGQLSGGILDTSLVQLAGTSGCTLAAQVDGRRIRRQVGHGNYNKNIS